MLKITIYHTNFGPRVSLSFDEQPKELERTDSSADMAGFNFKSRTRTQI